MPVLRRRGRRIYDITEPPDPSSATVTVGEITAVGDLFGYTSADTYEAGSEGSISPDPYEYGGAQVEIIRFETAASPTGWFVEIDGEHPQDFFSSIEIDLDGAGDTITLETASADGYSASGNTTWTWNMAGTAANGWTAADVGLGRTVTVSP